jgi:hypothetical protein
MKLRLEYWEKVKDIEPKNLVFLDETGVLLGLTRTHIMSGSITIIKPQLGATNGNLSNLELSLAVGVIVGSD